MLEVNYNIRSLISGIYECQKKIIITRRFISELETEGNDVTKLRNEIRELEKKIGEYRKDLKKRSQLVY
jgi:peptidoglycan hydrolase CwlO-like protein